MPAALTVEVDPRAQLVIELVRHHTKREDVSRQAVWLLLVDLSSRELERSSFRSRSSREWGMLVFQRPQ